MRVRFIGSGDAFGSGGRFNTCFLVEREAGGAFLIDCGASSLIAMRRQGADPNAVATVFVSHLHGDHFGGLPFFILDAQFYSRRAAPLTLVGPTGFGERLIQAMEVLFPGSSTARRRFALLVREVAPGEGLDVDGVALTTLEVSHACGAPPLALRVSCEGRTIAYSGDTEWTEALVQIGRGADLYIVEALSFARKIPQHLDYETFRANAARIGARRIILTHLGPEALERRGELGHEIAEDGMVVEV